MKVVQFLAAAAVVFCLSAPATWAQDDAKPKRPEAGERPARGERGAAGQGGPEQMLKRLPLMAALDSDGNGEISTEEIEAAVIALKSLDKNSDGKLTIDELIPQGGRPGAGPGGPGGLAGGAMIEQMFTNRDSDGDGKLSGDEIPEMLQGRLDRIDENGDGAIDKDEIKKAGRMLGRQRGAAGAEGNGGDGSGVKPKRP